MADPLKEFDYEAAGWRRRYVPTLVGVRVTWVSPKINEVELARMDADGGYWEPFYIAVGYGSDVYPTQEAAAKSGMKALERVKRNADAALAKLREAHEPKEANSVLVAVTLKH